MELSPVMSKFGISIETLTLFLSSFVLMLVTLKVDRFFTNASLQNQILLIKLSELLIHTCMTTTIKVCKCIPNLSISLETGFTDIKVVL